jgi:thiol:disulfide interchange protein
MRTKKIFGFVFIALAIILGVALIGQFHAVDSAVKGIFMALTGQLEPYQTGRAIGKMIYWVAHIMGMYLLWIYGRRWVREG